jgi:toxin ParE1/3/4
VKWRVVWGRRASGDVDAIADFIAQDSKSASRRVAEYIRRAGNSLSTFAHRGRPTHRLGVRELVLSRYPYVIVYELVEREVRILGVLHQSRDRP